MPEYPGLLPASENDGKAFDSIRPELHKEELFGDKACERPGSMQFDSGTIAAALCAIGFAGAMISTKLLSRTESTTSILFWLTVMQAVFGIICAGYDGDIAVSGLTTLPGIVVVGIGGLLAHFCITSALHLAPAVIVSPLDFIRLPIMAFVGLLLYQEALDGWVIFGALLVFGGNLLNIYVEHRGDKRSA